MENIKKFLILSAVGVLGVLGWLVFKQMYGQAVSFTVASAVLATNFVGVIWLGAKLGARGKGANPLVIFAMTLGKYLLVGGALYGLIKYRSGDIFWILLGLAVVLVSLVIVMTWQQFERKEPRGSL